VKIFAFGQSAHLSTLFLRVTFSNGARQSIDTKTFSDIIVSTLECRHSNVDMSVIDVNSMENLSVHTFERKSLSEQIAETLRISIMDGSLPPGTRLLEAQIAKNLAVSRSALRESLHTLQSEGLVEVRPNRGTYVPLIRDKDLEEIGILRSLLEPFVAGKVAEQATDEQIEQLQTLVSEMMNVARGGDYLGAADLDFQLHKTIWEISGHQRLKQILTGLQSQIRMFVTVNTLGDMKRHPLDGRPLGEMLADGFSDHQGVVDAIRSRHPEEAFQAMRHHIETAVDLMREFLHHKEVDHFE
jgi:DNA-binding GntR family transcriptional regulator